MKQLREFLHSLNNTSVAIAILIAIWVLMMTDSKVLSVFALVAASVGVAAASFDQKHPFYRFRRSK